MIATNASVLCQLSVCPSLHYALPLNLRICLFSTWSKPAQVPALDLNSFLYQVIPESAPADFVLLYRLLLIYVDPPNPHRQSTPHRYTGFSAPCSVCCHGSYICNSLRSPLRICSLYISFFSIPDNLTLSVILINPVNNFLVA